ncbi:MAG: TolC family protein [Candidatus Omnitrophica bacterium]|nr:TolC family protein [Candidatus Omnitrophota bacterium]MDE2221455.1 TolC family protein [Candidatus Omnitrophota bacterium]
MKTFTAVLISFILCLSQGLADQAVMPQSVSYKEYLSEVLAYYPLLKKEYASIEEAIAQKALAASSRMPRFWASADFQYGNDPVYVFGALLRQNRFSSDDFAVGRLNSPKPMSDNSASIEGQWLLFDFGQTASRLKGAGLLVQSSRYQAQAVQMEAILAASEVYSRLAMTQKLIKMFDEACAQGATEVAFAEQLRQEGLALGADFYLARLTQTKLAQAVNEMKAQEAALSMVFNILRGKDPALPVKVNLDYQKSPHLEGSLGEWMDKSIRKRLDIKAMAKQLEAQGVDVDREKMSFLPRISGYGQAAQHAHGIGLSGGGNYVVGLKATLDIFDPGYKDRVKLASAQQSRLASQYRQAMDQAASDAAETYYQLQALKSNKALAAKALEDARQARQLTVPLYKEGRRSIEQMLSLEAGVAEAYEHWLRLENAYCQRMLALKFYAGELDQKQAGEIYGNR